MFYIIQVSKCEYERKLFCPISLIFIGTFPRPECTKLYQSLGVIISLGIDIIFLCKQDAIYSDPRPSIPSCHIKYSVALFFSLQSLTVKL